MYQSFIFIRVGVVNTKIYRGSEELEHFKRSVKEDRKKYMQIANQFGYYGKSLWTIRTDPVDEVYRIVKKLMPLLPNPTFFGDQLVISKALYLSQLLHNHTHLRYPEKVFQIWNSYCDLSYQNRVSFPSL